MSRQRIKTVALVMSFFVIGFLKESRAQVNISELKMETRPHNYGIVGAEAPELRVNTWIDGEGNAIEPIQLKNNKGKFKVIYGFQSWCPGCHSRGLPALQEMVKALEGSDKVMFVAIQTVFEGKHANTFDRMKEVQEQYDLQIPFGHDEGDKTTRNISSVMHDYRTGGTPWFILIDQNNKVVFNDYFLNTEKAIEYLKTIK